jgi:hypothetical protein
MAKLLTTTPTRTELMRQVELFTHAAQEINRIMEDVRCPPELEDIFAGVCVDRDNRYPFHLSFDKLVLGIMDWRDLICRRNIYSEVDRDKKNHNEN